MLRHNTVVTVSFQPPDRLVDLLLTKHLSWMHGEKFQNIKLRLCQTDLLPVKAYTAFIVANPEPFRLLALLFALSAPLLSPQMGHA